MKSSIHLRLLSLFTLLFTLGWTTSAFAQGTGTKDDPYIMEDGGEYAFKVFKDFYGEFIVPEDVTNDGVVLEIVAPNWVDIFADKEREQLVSVTTGNFAPYTSTVDIAKGTPKGTVFYIYSNFPVNSGSAKVSYGGGSCLELVNVTPAEGSILSAGEGYIGFEFSKPMRFDRCMLIAGGKEIALTTNVTDRFISIEAKAELMECYNSGALKKGDDILVTLSNVVSYDGKSAMGDVVIRYTAAEKPITLVSSVNTPETGMPQIKSWMPTTGDLGLVQLTFDGKLNKEAKIAATLSYGNSETEDPGEYYQEEVTPTFLNDYTIALDLRGKLRIPSQMVSSGTNYETMLLTIRGVEDEDGFRSYVEGSGSAGAYFLDFGYELVTYSLMTEFMPASGQSIDGVKEIEIWMQELGSNMAFSGASFEYVYEGKNQVIEVASENITVTPDEEDETACYLTIPVPTFSRDANTQVKFTLKDVVYPDGMDYSEYVTAVYTTKGYEAPTGINTITANKANQIYTLDGKIMNKALKSNTLYIINGKKVMVK